MNDHIESITDTLFNRAGSPDPAIARSARLAFALRDVANPLPIIAGWSEPSAETGRFICGGVMFYRGEQHRYAVTTRVPHTHEVSDDPSIEAFESARPFLQDAFAEMFASLVMKDEDAATIPWDEVLSADGEGK